MTAGFSFSGSGRLSRWLAPTVFLLLGILLWEALVRVTETPRWFLPPPSAVGLALVQHWRLLAAHTWVTLQEVLVGFLLAFGLGVATAIAITASKLVERILYPVVIASQAIPIIALAPILLIWFGYDMTPKVIVVVLICFFPIAVNTVDGLRSVDPDLINLLRSMGADQRRIFRTVRIPASLPYLFSGTRVAAAVSVIGALIGEWIGASSGLGYYMIRAASQFFTDRLFAAVLISAALGVALFALVGLLQRLCVPWERAAHEGE